MRRAARWQRPPEDRSTAHSGPRSPPPEGGGVLEAVQGVERSEARQRRGTGSSSRPSLNWSTRAGSPSGRRSGARHDHDNQQRPKNSSTIVQATLTFADSPRFPAKIVARSSTTTTSQSMITGRSTNSLGFKITAEGRAESTAADVVDDVVDGESSRKVRERRAEHAVRVDRRATQPSSTSSSSRQSTSTAAARASTEPDQRAPPRRRRQPRRSSASIPPPTMSATTNGSSIGKNNRAASGRGTCAISVFVSPISSAFPVAPNTHRSRRPHPLAPSTPTSQQFRAARTSQIRHSTSKTASPSDAVRPRHVGICLATVKRHPLEVAEHPHRLQRSSQSQKRHLTSLGTDPRFKDRGREDQHRALGQDTSRSRWAP